MPAGVRRSVGEPGYTGHKRGDVRVRHVPLLHAGAGLWLAYRLVEKEGSIVPVLAELLKVGLASLPRARTVVRGDGEFGSVGAMSTVADAGAHHLTRVSRYPLLDREEVAAAFPTLVWREVPSAGAGPARQAADLGVFEFHPSEGAAGTGAPVSTRVVVSRFQRSSPPEHGVLRGGYQIELFATSLPADAWPAGDTVALYFGRGAIENRYAQEDREFDMGRTFSEHAPGQEWVAFLAYFLWNLMVCEGTAATAALPTPAPQEALPSQAPGPHEGSSPLEVNVEPPGQEAQIAAHDAPGVDSLPSTSAAADDLAPTDDANEAAEVWRLVRDAVPLRPNWRLDDDAHALRCPTGKRHYVFAAYPSTSQHNKANRILLRGEIGACDGCPLRHRCSAHKPGTYKQLSVRVPEGDARRASALLARARDSRPRRPPTRPRERDASPSREVQSPAVPHLAHQIGPLLPPGPLVPASPLYLPAAARALARGLLNRSSLDVYVGHAAAVRQSPHPLVAANAAARRHGRLTWNQRRMRWADDPEVLIVATGSRTQRVARLFDSLKVSRKRHV